MLMMLALSPRSRIFCHAKFADARDVGHRVGEWAGFHAGTADARDAGLKAGEWNALARGGAADATDAGFPAGE